MKKEVSIVWFRQDLRILDNPALAKGVEKGALLPIYILDDCAPAECKIGNRSKLWLHQSLAKLN